ncbi:hypothetical protein KSH72_027225, partial [Escherichia coli]|nr:hypothetical protein [Escherichia coli]
GCIKVLLINRRIAVARHHRPGLFISDLYQSLTSRPVSDHLCVGCHHQPTGMRPVRGDNFIHIHNSASGDIVMQGSRKVLPLSP